MPHPHPQRTADAKAMGSTGKPRRALASMLRGSYPSTAIL